MKVQKHDYPSIDALALALAGIWFVTVVISLIV